jgi:hypothetical protein
MVERTYFGCRENVTSCTENLAAEDLDLLGVVSLSIDSIRVLSVRRIPKLPGSSINTKSCCIYYLRAIRLILTCLSTKFYLV